MAKKEEIEQVVIEDEEQQEEEIVVKSVEEELVRIVPKRSFTCRIGDNWYAFEENKPQKVSKHVEEALRKDETKLYL